MLCTSTGAGRSCHRPCSGGGGRVSPRSGRGDTRRAGSARVARGTAVRHPRPSTPHALLLSCDVRASGGACGVERTYPHARTLGVVRLLPFRHNPRRRRVPLSRIRWVKGSYGGWCVGDAGGADVPLRIHVSQVVAAHAALAEYEVRMPHV